MTNGSRKIQEELNVTQETNSLLETVTSLASYQKMLNENIGVAVTKYLEMMFGGAVALNSSDIHLEPEEEQIKMRLRVDGILHDVMVFSPEDYRGLLSRLKLMSGLKLNISDRPQDGHFSVVIGDLEIEIRVSSLPSEHGETIVMRLLNPTSLKSIPELGLRKDLLDLVEAEIKKPNGMIISTGPTGSGKTTTLYAFCKKLAGPEIKVITIEDPIEYHLDGLSQTQVDTKKGYSFASGLRSIVRQDPDVILVGEMRDDETVEMALQAALTGHLVLTTLHTNDAAGAITRLISLEGKTVNIGPALSMVLGQRLIRKLCECKKSVELSGDVKKFIDSELEGVLDAVEIPSTKDIYEANGCDICNNTGYKGRVGIFEIFLIDDEMEELIVSEPSTASLRSLAKKKGMVSMRQDGIIKILEGRTSIEEVKRVTI